MPIIQPFECSGKVDVEIVLRGVVLSPDSRYVLHQIFVHFRREWGGRSDLIIDRRMEGCSLFSDVKNLVRRKLDPSPGTNHLDGKDVTHVRLYCAIDFEGAVASANLLGGHPLFAPNDCTGIYCATRDI